MMGSGSTGAIPRAPLEDLRSDVVRLQTQVNDDRAARAKDDGRLQAVEKSVHHLERVVKWGLGLLAGLVVSGFGAVLTALLDR